MMWQQTFHINPFIGKPGFTRSTVVKFGRYQMSSNRYNSTALTEGITIKTLTFQKPYYRSLTQCESHTFYTISQSFFI